MICVEIFAWNKYGGFGRATRTIGRELVKQGLEVFAVVPRREGQAAIENLDGIQVHAFEPHNPFKSMPIFRWINADIYHSQEPSFATYLAQRAMPHKAHVVTCRDTRNLLDWRMEFREYSRSKLQVAGNFLFEDNWFVRTAVRRADVVCAASRFLVDKARQKYRLGKAPRFLPTPVDVPEEASKSEKPLVSYVARFDRRKRPESFCRLAAYFPGVTFIALGQSQDPHYDRYIRQKYRSLPNLQMPGFVDQFSGDAHSRILDKSWILVNTAMREGLPNAFIEAAAHRCAILSRVNPDGFARRFGYWARRDDFHRGLKALLHDHNWQQRGERAHAYVARTFATQKAIDRHIALYRALTGPGNDTQF